LVRSFPGAASRVERDGYTLLRVGNTLTMQLRAWCHYGRYANELDGVVEFVNVLPFLTPLYVKATPAVAVFYQTAEEVWGHELPQPAALIGRYLVEPWCLRRYRKFPALAISESTRASLARRGFRDITVVPVGADTVITLGSLPPKEKVPTVLFVGRLTANKRPDHAVAAFRQLKERLPEAALWVAGRGPMAARLEAEAPAGTTFFGHVPEAKKHELMARAHAVVATSVREGWGMTVSEAALLGTRAVGYDVAGLRDSVRAAGGTLVEPEPRALAAALAERLPTWVNEYGHVPADVGVTSWENVAASIMTGLQKVVANQPSRIGERRPAVRHQVPAPGKPAAGGDIILVDETGPSATPRTGADNSAAEVGPCGSDVGTVELSGELSAERR
jgi:glycosyltransferase involved in cell wall biosynthesis